MSAHALGADNSARVAAFKAARRHTLFVKTLRVVLPAISLGGLLAYGIALKGQFSFGSGSVKTDSIEITSEDLKMKNPSYFGATKDNGRYNVRAAEAAVGLSMKGPINLKGIDGDITQANGSKTNLRANRGILEREKSEIQLLDGVTVATSNGMKAELKSAHVYAKDHRIVSREPLRANMPAGTLHANTMDVKTDTRQAHFGGKVALKLTPSQDPNAAKTPLSLGGDGKQPVEIWAETFAIDDAARTAAFKGGVIAQQGESQLKAPELHLAYESKAGAADATGAAKPGAGVLEPGAQSQLTRMRAINGVVLTSGTSRRVIAETADFDVSGDAATLTGNVEVTQGKNVLRGGRFWLDRKAGRSKLDSPAQSARTPGRIFATFTQASDGKAPVQKTKTEGSAEIAGFGSFKNDPNAPIDIDAETLEINDATKTATFRGKVVAKQGDMVITSSELVAHFSGQGGLVSAAGGDEKSDAQISRIETRGGTIVKSKDGQEATADTATMDVKSNTVLMQGKDGVLLKQGQNMTRGARLRFDIKTGEARLENDKTQPIAVPMQPTPAQASINAKPGVAPPQQPTTLNCAGQQCLVIYPQQLKEQRAKEDQSKSQRGPGSLREKVKDWQPSTSPSPVYRSN